MCKSSRPQEPHIIHQGPTQADVYAQQASLQQYQAQMQQQQSAFQQQLQSQIDAANKQSEMFMSMFEQESAAAQQEQVQIQEQAPQTTAYTVTAGQSGAPEAAQTTAAVTKKEKPKSGLKIAPAAMATSAGTGLNIGV